MQPEQTNTEGQEGQRSGETSNLIEKLLQTMMLQLQAQQRVQASAAEEADAKARAAERASSKQCDALQNGLRHMARGMTASNFIREIKICGYEATGLQRVAYVKKCEDRHMNEDYDEAWACLQARSTDVPTSCRTTAEACIKAQGNLTAEAFRRIAREFIFRKRQKTADDIAEEAVDLMTNYGPVKGSKIHEYYGVGRRAWGSVTYAYDLEDIGTKPARATNDSFFRAWTANLEKEIKKHVRLQRTQARNRGDIDSFTLESAYNAAQDYMDCDEKDSNQAIVSKEMLRKANLLAMVGDPSAQNSTDVSKKRSQCRFFARGHCRKGDKCKFSHDRKRERDDSNDGRQEDHKRRRNNDRRNDRCRKCGSDEHQYSPVCPEYKGCNRCNSKEHMLSSCTEECAKCGAGPKEKCETDCPNRPSSSSFRR